MAKVDLSGVTSGSFGYLREHFWDLAKVSLLPVLLCAVCFSISGYFSFVQLKSLTEGSGDFALNWIGFYFGLLPDFLVIWLWVRVVKFVYNDGAGTFEIRPSELKSSLFAILYLLAALIPFAVLWIVMAVVIAVAAGGHVSGVIGLSLFVLIPATMVFALWYFARVSVSIVPVANGSRPNLFSQFVQASAGNNWGLVGRFLAMALLGFAVELVVALPFFYFVSGKLYVLGKGASITEIAAVQLEMWQSFWPFVPVAAVLIWIYFLLQSVFVSLLAERFPRIGRA